MTYNAKELDKFIRRIRVKAEEAYKLSKVLNVYCEANSTEEGLYEISTIVNQLYNISDKINGILAYYEAGEIVD